MSVVRSHVVVAWELTPGSARVRLVAKQRESLAAPIEMSQRVTIVAVAKQAGVHPTTVSLALRNDPALPLVTRERLQALAREMGYRRDPALASLAAYRAIPSETNRLTLAYVTNWETPWGWKDLAAPSRFYAGASEKAPQLGYRLEHFWLSEEGQTPRQLGEKLVARGINGVILASHSEHKPDFVDFDWNEFSGVKIDFFPHQPILHRVTNDQCAIAQLAMRRTLAAGYRRVGCVVAEWWNEIVDLAWSAGFLSEQQHVPEEDRIPMLIFPAEERQFLCARDIFERWFNEHRPEAIVSYGPFVRPRLDELGLSIPRDVAFVDLMLKSSDGQTAGVRQNCHRVGELAVEIVAGLIHQGRRGALTFPIKTFVEGTWFEGASLPTRVAATPR